MKDNFILYLFVRIELFAFAGVAVEQQEQQQFAGGLNPIHCLWVFSRSALSSSQLVPVVSSNLCLYFVLLLGKDIVNTVGLLQQFRAKLL